MKASAKTKKTKTTIASKGKTLEEFRSMHDKNYIVPRKIKEALAKLGEGWEYEGEFIKLAGLAHTDLATFRDQFEDHIVAVKTNGSSHRKNVWAGTVAFATKLREMTS